LAAEGEHSGSKEAKKGIYRKLTSQHINLTKMPSGKQLKSVCEMMKTFEVSADSNMMSILEV
jgi:hypothetical protein